MNRSESFFFAWDGSHGAEGPWRHLLVLEAAGREAISADYDYDIELALAEGASPVALPDLLASKATLQIRSRVSPTVRLVHGIIIEAEEIAVDTGHRYRVRLAPPYSIARLQKKCSVFVDKTLRDIIEQTLTRSARGMALSVSTDDRQEVSEPVEDFAPFSSTYAFRCFDWSRLAAAEARPYCVQYNESDVDFVTRLLEEEGIAYHFEHTKTECVLVLSDKDIARRALQSDLVLTPDTAGRELRNMRLGGRTRPQKVALDDYDWRKPDLDLAAASDFPGDVVTEEQPGRYGSSSELGKTLARIRDERHDTERCYARFDTAARELSAGTLFSIEHPNESLSGVFLADKLTITMRQRASFGASDGEPTYKAVVEAVRGGGSGTAVEDVETHYRPARATRVPRIRGSQTAVVTAEPGQDQEINVGGESDLGCVRVRFHWDHDDDRCSKEASSCWVRVSQMFAGGKGHGALFHPRVGDEVLIDYIDGDPDRPMVVGRVYNGKNLAPENATARPTYSAIKSMTSPYNGNFNMIAFDDLQGEEKFIVHVAKDYISNIKHDSSRFVANFDKVEVKGNQETLIHGSQDFRVLSGQDITIHDHQNITVYGPQMQFITGDQSEGVQGSSTRSVIGSLTEKVGANETITVGAAAFHTAGIMIIEQAPMINLHAKAIVTITGNVVTISGATVHVSAGTATVSALGDVSVSGANVNVNAGTINLNC
jgi:type VI secretion system secreted protein VgrG